MVDEKQKQKLLVLSDYYSPGYRSGGLAISVSNFVNSFKDYFDIHLFSRNCDLGEAKPYTLAEKESVYNPGFNLTFISANFIGYQKFLTQIAFKNYDIIYLNSFYSLKFSIIPLLIFKIRNIPIVVAVRGEFSQSAMSLKSRRKSLYRIIFKLLGLHKKIYFQASNKYEAKDIQRVLGKFSKVCIANDLYEYKPLLDARSYSKNLRIVFMSRITPIKNLIFVISILQEVSSAIDFEIFGPIEDEKYWQKVSHKISVLPPNIRVKYHGEVHQKNVITNLAKYDLFFLPSLSENFGHVICEALMASVPVLISDRTPWKNLLSDNIGWDLSLDYKEGFVKVIDTLATESLERRLERKKEIFQWGKKNLINNKFKEQHLVMFNRVFKNE